MALLKNNLGQIAYKASSKLSQYAFGSSKLTRALGSRE